MHAADGATIATHDMTRDMRAIRTTENEVHDRTGWSIIESSAATPQLSGRG